MNIVGATNSSYIWFDVYGHQSPVGEYFVGSAPLFDSEWFNPNDVDLNEKEWDPVNERIKLSENKFAFLNNPLSFKLFYGSTNIRLTIWAYTSAWGIRTTGAGGRPRGPRRGTG